jgi:acetylornithine aminotransferase
MNNPFSFAQILGSHGPALEGAMRAGSSWLATHSEARLLNLVGRIVEEVPPFQAIDKSSLPDSFGGGQTSPPDDLLVGRGLFYLSEQRRLFLDCTSGHYQMLWGYNHPALDAAVAAATQLGVVWDNHSNIPQAPVKYLAHRLVSLANPAGQKDPLNTVLLGVCTGSVACGAALKIMLKVYQARRHQSGVPVILTLDGNYHGTDMVPQFLRGMWPHLVSDLEVVKLEPNHPEALASAFQKYGTRVAGFWAEPVMMNREAIAVEADYLRLARQWCDEVGALLCIDEIQTGFWQSRVFAFRELDLHPDLVVVGKGMTAGFHPLSGVILKERLDVLEQYDAISTNGSAALPSYVALCSLQMIESMSGRISQIGQKIMDGFCALVSEFPEHLQAAHGRGYLAGLKFRRVEAAQNFQRDLLKAGLWTRVHAYHEGHRTLLTKLGLLSSPAVVDFMLGQFRLLLQAIR